EDAVQELQGSTIFHLVFLDLRLPNAPGMPPSSGVELGVAVLKQCEERDRYPIPALIIRSGCLGDANQSDLRTRVEGAFCYGAVLVKGGSLDSELDAAVRRIHAYCGVGI